MTARDAAALCGLALESMLGMGRENPTYRAKRLAVLGCLRGIRSANLPALWEKKRAALVKAVRATRGTHKKQDSARWRCMLADCERLQNYLLNLI